MGLHDRRVRVLNITGIRSEESPDRAKVAPYRNDPRASNTTAGAARFDGIGGCLDLDQCPADRQIGRTRTRLPKRRDDGPLPPLVEFAAGVAQVVAPHVVRP